MDPRTATQLGAVAGRRVTVHLASVVLAVALIARLSTALPVLRRAQRGGAPVSGLVSS